MSSEKKTQGRQKIEMKRMSNENNMQVTFSKRRSGLFNKASEISTLCGVDVVLIIFSPSGKVFSFSHPNIETVIDRYLSRVPPPNDGTLQFIEAHRIAIVCNRNTTLTQVKNDIDNDKRRNDELSDVRKMNEAQYGRVCPIDEMDMAQLDFFKKCLEQLNKIVDHYLRSPYI